MESSLKISDNLVALKTQLADSIGWLEPKEIIYAEKILKKLENNIEYLSFCISETTCTRIGAWGEELKSVVDFFTIKAGLNRLEIEYVA